MAVAPAVEPLLKSNPDMGKINGMSGYVVTVTKHAAAKGSPGSSVIATQEMSKSDLLSLQAKLPLSAGAGWYKFIVSDVNSGIEDSWMVKLGVDPSAPQEGFNMPGPGVPPMSPIPRPPVGEGVHDLGHGFYFNENYGTLTTPWRKVYNWKPGEPMPEPPQAPASHLAAVPPNATPWNWQPPGMPSQWGGYPAGPSETDVLKAELAEQRRLRERDEDKNEQRRREEDQRRRDEERDKRFEQLVAALTAKPAGPSETELALRREVEETKRRTEEAERETRRREEARAAEERHRAEMQALRDVVKESTANRPDPMLNLLGQFLATSQATQGENIRMIREAGTQTAAAAERGAQQVLELARTQRDGAVEAANTTVAMMKDNMATMKGFYSEMLELKGSPDAPWWAGPIMEGVNRLGAIGQAMAEAKAQAAEVQYTPPQPGAARPAQPMPARPAARPVPGQPMPAQPQRVAPPAARPQADRPGAPTTTGERPPGTKYDAKTEEFVLPGGARVKQSAVEREGWTKVLEELAVQAQMQPQPPQPQPPVQPPAPAPTNGVSPKGKKKGPRAAAPPPPQPAPAPVGMNIPPPKDGKGYRPAELREFDPDQVRVLAQQLDDNGLFGVLLPRLIELREHVARGLPPEKAAEAILGVRPYLSALGATPPDAFLLLASEHFEVLVERVLPEAPEEYQDAVIDAIETQLDAEDGGTRVQQREEAEAADAEAE